MKKSKGYKKIGTKNGLNLYEAIIEVGTNIDGKRVRVKRRHTGLLKNIIINQKKSI